MSLPKRKEEDGGELESPFAGLQKAQVLRDARTLFNATSLDINKCCLTLTRILHLLQHGEEFTKEETTDVFFSVTKLFQSQDPFLRRLTYLVLRELPVGSEESLIVVACLNKDMTSRNDLFRANSIRVLARVMDPGMVPQIERFLRQSLVDREPLIVANTLCAAQVDKLLHFILPLFMFCLSVVT